MNLIKKYKVSLLFSGLFSMSSAFISCSSDNNETSEPVAETIRELKN